MLGKKNKTRKAIFKTALTLAEQCHEIFVVGYGSKRMNMAKTGVYCFCGIDF